MPTFRRILTWAALASIAVLTALSVWASFLGERKAGEFFNSAPLAVYWALSVVLLAGGIAAFSALRRRIGLLAAHVGCIMVLGGAMWGSEAGHRLQATLLGRSRIPDGYMRIRQGRSENELTDIDGEQRLGRLPFDVRLEKFWVEYYPDDAPEWQLVVVVLRMRPGGVLAEHTEPIHWRIGTEAAIPLTDARLRMLVWTVQPRAASTPPLTWPPSSPPPRLRLELRRRDKTLPCSFGYPEALELRLSELYENSRAWHDAGMPTLTFRRSDRPIRDYKSRLAVVEQGRLVARKDIEVNHPLHYGGYHLYQADYDHESGQYSIVRVVSDSGLSVVRVGLVMLCAGVTWQCWLEPILRKLRGAPS